MVAAMACAICIAIGIEIFLFNMLVYCGWMLAYPYANKAHWTFQFYVWASVMILWPVFTGLIFRRIFLRLR